GTGERRRPRRWRGTAWPPAAPGPFPHARPAGKVVSLSPHARGRRRGPERGGRDRVGRTRPSPGVSRSSGGVPAVEPDDPAQLLGVAAGALARQGLPAFREVEARLPEGVVLAEHRRPQRLGAVLRGERLVALGDDEPHGPFRPPE